MSHRFADIAFTPSVQSVQAKLGSRANYAKWDQGPDVNGELTAQEVEFIGERDSFYMASVSESGWPYVQHRGGPPGFVKALDSKTLGFADYRGNRQYISVGNFLKDNRVSLILVDYPNRRRLKLLGHIEIVEEQNPKVLERLTTPGYKARVERGFLIHVAAFDWNCPQHISPRYTVAQVEAAVAPLKARILELEARLSTTTPT